jgi:hypothetical protein
MEIKGTTSLLRIIEIQNIGLTIEVDFSTVPGTIKSADNDRKTALVGTYLTVS